MYTHFSEMAWPVPDKKMQGLQWRLRYQQGPLLIEDRLVAASIIYAYCALLEKNKKERDFIIKNIKAEKVV